MNANIYEYGIDPKTGLNRRLVRDTAIVQEEMDDNPLQGSCTFKTPNLYH